MWLVYLLMMLDNLETVACSFMVMSAICLALGIILSAVAKAQEGSRHDDFTDKGRQVIYNLRKIALRVFIPSCIIFSFVPNSKQAAVIFTIGNTIEYVQGNEKIKELPDKAVECLDKFISDYLDNTSTKDSQ